MIAVAGQQKNTAGSPARGFYLRCQGRHEPPSGQSIPGKVTIKNAHSFEWAFFMIAMAGQQKNTAGSSARGFYLRCQGRHEPHRGEVFPAKVTIFEWVFFL